MQWSMAVELNSPLTSVSLLPYKTKGTIRAPVPLLDHMSYDVTGPPTHGRGSIETYSAVKLSTLACEYNVNMHVNFQDHSTYLFSFIVGALIGRGRGWP